MPELPEVEEARRCLQRWARGRTVRGVKVTERRVVAAGAPALTSLAGARFVDFDRRGKHLLLGLERGRQKVGLWSHLGMTGKWLRRGPGEPASRFSRVEVQLDDGATLHYDDLRLFGRLRAVPGADFGQLPAVAELGPDPLHEGIDVDRLAARLGRSKKPIKPLLLDQSLVAGIGNIQASESLFRASIDPRRPASSLSRPEVARLARAMRASIDYTLRQFDKAVGGGKGAQDIRYVEDPGGPNPFKVYDRAGAPCPRCRQRAGQGTPRGTIVRIVQAGRATFYCDRCQK